jgi:hypothetical protein
MHFRNDSRPVSIADALPKRLKTELNNLVKWPCPCFVNSSLGIELVENVAAKLIDQSRTKLYWFEGVQQRLFAHATSQNSTSEGCKCHSQIGCRQVHDRCAWSVAANVRLMSKAWRRSGREGRLYTIISMFLPAVPATRKPDEDSERPGSGSLMHA